MVLIVDLLFDDVHLTLGSRGLPLVRGAKMPRMPFLCRDGWLTISHAERRVVRSPTP